MGFDAGSIRGRIEIDTVGFEAGTRRVGDAAKQLAQTLDRDLGRAGESATATLQAGISDVAQEMTATTPAAQELAATIASAGETLSEGGAAAADFARGLSDHVSPAAQEVQREIEQARGRLRDLDSEMARASTSNRDPFVKLLKGAGAAAIVRQVSREVEQFGAAVIDAQVAMQSGEKTGSELAGELARSIPLLGDMVRAFDSVGAAVTGAGAAMAKMNAESARMQGTSDAIANMLGIADDAAKRFGREGMVQDLDQDLLDEAEARLEAIERAKRERVGALSKGRDAGDPAVAAEIAQVQRAAQQASARVRAELRGALGRREAGREAAAQMQREQQQQREREQQERADREMADRSRREAEQLAAAAERQRAREAEQMARDGEQAARERQRVIGRRAQSIGAAIDLGSSDFGGAPGGISVNVPGIDPDRLGQAISGHLQPVIEHRISQAEAGARAARYAASVRRGL